MTRFAEYFATVSNDGKILNIVAATPAHELRENQIMLTAKEFRLLEVVRTLDEGKKLFASIEYKIGELDGREKD